ncbi:MAG: DUF3119 family protein [Synechococcaceae bacterium WB6_3B_236]|nr:DUF3119 family protein [Synechococcaceae bacterium WB6_3B_236]
MGAVICGDFNCPGARSFSSPQEQLIQHSPLVKYTGKPQGISPTAAPRPWLALGLLALAAGLLLVWWPAAAGLGLFGLFLLLQTALLRLRFEPEALVVLRQGVEIRRFSYGDWLSWRVFWPPVPVLFYFREVHSIHFLPMLFDATALARELNQRLDPQLNRPAAPVPNTEVANGAGDEVPSRPE